MIALHWWLIPLIVSALPLLSILWAARARDIFEAGLAMTVAITSVMVTVVLWTVFFTIKVLQ